LPSLDVFFKDNKVYVKAFAHKKRLG
jgi:hypothetical protein